MNLTAPSEVKALLDQLDFRPSKVLGQNFLIDANILKIILTTAFLHQSDGVLEIGPGLGVLTEWLARWSGKVVAIEKDRRLFDYLSERFEKTRNLRLIHADALDVNLDEILADGVNKVVANLPYSVGSRLLVELTELPHRPEQIVVTVQREVAERLTAKPGTRDYGLLTVFAQLRYDIGIRKEVSPTCFYPPPDVHSAIVNMVLRDEQPELRDVEQFKALVKTAFAQRRKQLLTVLKKNFPTGIEDTMQKLGIDLRARPENLSPTQWTALANALAK